LTKPGVSVSYVPVARGKKRSWRLVWRCLLIALALAGSALVVLWMMFQHKPAWYRPVIADAVTVQRAQSSSASVVDSISDRLAGAEPFELRLESGMVNEWIASLPQLWPQIGSTMSERGISDVAISFDAECIRVGALLDISRPADAFAESARENSRSVENGHGGLQAIVSVGLEFNISGDGSAVVVRLKDVRGGSLPMPRSSLAGVVEQLTTRNRPNLRREDDIVGSFTAALEEIRSLDELYQGISVRNRFVWPNGDRPFRMSHIRSGKGRIDIGFERL